MPTATLDDLRSRIGTNLGSSEWITVDQARIDAFAEATEDHQFIHVDPERAAKTMFGGTIAHGFLSLSLLSRMAEDVLPIPKGIKLVVNYGFDNIRFLAPVPAGSRLRGHFKLEDIEERGPGQLLMHNQVTVEIDGTDKPALTADWLGLLVL